MKAHLRSLALLVFAACGSAPLAQEPGPLADGSILQREEVVAAKKWPARARAILKELRVERIVYASSGLEVEGFLLMPRSTPKAPLPAVVYCRGGNRDFGALSGLRTIRMLAPLAKQGYVVVASNYRGNGKHGAAKYPGERTCKDCKSKIGGKGREQFGGADVNDVLALLPLLDALPEADGSRVGLYGWSRGGMMVYQTLRRTNRFKAAVVGAGMSDLAGAIKARPSMEAHVMAELIPGWNDKTTRAAAIEARSAVRWADELPATTPILILHGTADWRVEPTAALDMAGALQRAKRPYRLMMFEGGDHGLTGFNEESDAAVNAWLRRWVRDGAKLPNLKPHGR